MEQEGIMNKPAQATTEPVGGRRMSKTYFHKRKATADCPAGITVSKKAKLPEGDFKITEYSWGSTKLWFVDVDNFSADERQSIYYAFCNLDQSKPRCCTEYVRKWWKFWRPK